MTITSRNLSRELGRLNKTQSPLSGTLGMIINGSQVVAVPDRPGFVYVNLRDDGSELIQAFNQKVSLTFGLPVLLEYRVRRYEVTGRDTMRYVDWGTDSAYLPVHSQSHSMLRDVGGSDPVFLDTRQIFAGTVYPSGTAGSSNVLISELIYRNQVGAWKYAGNTGTPDLGPLYPTGTSNQAKLVLICFDYNTGGLVILTGTTFSDTLTGTSQIYPYIPVTNLSQIPLAAVRLVSGTTGIGWDNIYDMRQWIDSGFSTGTSGGGGGSTGTTPTTPDGSYKDVQYVSISGTFAGSDSFQYDPIASGVYIGPPHTGSVPIQGAIVDFVRNGSSTAFQLWTYGVGTAPFVAGLNARGNVTSPTGLLSGDGLLRMRGRGFDGTDWSNPAATVQMVTNENWAAGSHGARIEILATPTGTTSNNLVGYFSGDETLLSRPINIGTYTSFTNFTTMLSSASGTFNDIDIGEHYGIVFLSSTSKVQRLTGFNGGRAGRLLCVINDSDAFSIGPIALIHESSESAVANRITIGSPSNGESVADTYVSPGSAVLLQYGTAGRWDILAITAFASQSNPIMNSGTVGAPGTLGKFFSLSDHRHPSDSSKVTLVSGTISITGTISASNFYGVSSGTNTGDIPLLLPFGVYQNLSPMSPPSVSFPYMTTIDRSLNLKKLTYGLEVLTTNNASNYWNLSLRTLASGTVVKDINTSALSPNIPAQLTASSFSKNSVNAGDIAVYLQCSPSGTPGSLYLAGPMLEVFL